MLLLLHTKTRSATVSMPFCIALMNARFEVAFFKTFFIFFLTEVLVKTKTKGGYSYHLPVKPKWIGHFGSDFHITKFLGFL